MDEGACEEQLLFRRRRTLIDKNQREIRRMTTWALRFMRRQAPFT